MPLSDWLYHPTGVTADGPCFLSCQERIILASYFHTIVKVTAVHLQPLTEVYYCSIVGCKRLHRICNNYVDDRDRAEGETGKTITTPVVAFFRLL